MSIKIPSKIPDNATRVFSGVIYDIYQWQQELFDGSTATFEMAGRAPVVSIIPVIDDQLVVLHEEQPFRGETIGFPGGHMDAGEDPLSAAKRELHEETGMNFKSLKLVRVDDIGDGKMDWWCFRFIATDFTGQEEPHQDPGERIMVELVDFERAKELSVGNIYMSHEIMDKVDSLEELLAFPGVVIS